MLVQWDQDGTKNVVALNDLSYDGHIGVSSRVEMMWEGTAWPGKVLDLDEDAEDDTPLIKFVTSQKLGIYN